jgi:lysylphosphatidylglycerol synthetase-like protein (DUF2156 family)
MDKLRRALSGEDNESTAEQGGFHEIIDASSLSWSTRIKGFIACFVIGFLLSVLGSALLFIGKSGSFAVLYTLGSIVGLASTMFLMGPLNQLKKMFASTRIIATIIMIASLVLTLMAVFWWHRNGLAMLFIVIQFLAMTWYSLSYIPYARDAVKKVVSGVC